VRVVLVTALFLAVTVVAWSTQSSAGSRTSSWHTRVPPAGESGLIIIGEMAIIGGAITGPPRLKCTFVLSVVESSVFGMASGA
jgi:hypothetical protein